MSEEERFVKAAKEIQETLNECHYIQFLRSEKTVPLKISNSCNGTIAIDNPGWISPLSKLFPGVSFDVKSERVPSNNDVDEVYYWTNFEKVTKHET